MNIESIKFREAAAGWATDLKEAFDQQQDWINDAAARIGRLERLLEEAKTEAKAARRSANRLRVGILLMIFAFIGAQAWELLK